MNILSRKKLDRVIHLMAGDTLCVTHYDGAGTEKVLCKHSTTAEQAMTIDESLLFETVFEGRRALGGMVLEQVK